MNPIRCAEALESLRGQGRIPLKVRKGLVKGKKQPIQERTSRFDAFFKSISRRTNYFLTVLANLMSDCGSHVALQMVKNKIPQSDAGCDAAT
jgi:hypothetical protein